MDKLLFFVDLKRFEVAGEYGGFNGLSRFVPPIRFDPDEYLEIIRAFLAGKRSAAGKEEPT